MWNQLPWARYAYRCMPQGLMPTSDIFQSKMIEIFGTFDDIIVYIDNIILFTKETFQHQKSFSELSPPLAEG